MRNSCTIALAAAFAALSQAVLAANAGVKTLSIPAPGRSRPVKVTVFYPAAEGGAATLVGDNALFDGIVANLDAPVLPGLHPLVLLSHGLGGNAANLAWLATRLAARGMIVAAPDHPGSTSGDSTPQSTVPSLLLRPSDLSATLDALSETGPFKDHVDKGKISALGFSLGGQTVLALAGARFDAAAYARYCDEHPAAGDCLWFESGKINLHALPAGALEKPFADRRVKTIVAIDPALARAIVPDSLATIAAKALVINLGHPGSTWPGIDAAPWVEKLEGAVYATVPDAIHYSFLGLCNPDGDRILAAAGEPEPLCSDGGGRPRSALHDDIAAKIANFYERAGWIDR